MIPQRPGHHAQVYSRILFGTGCFVDSRRGHVVHLLASGCLQDLSYSVSVQDGDVEGMEVDVGSLEGQGSSGAPLMTTSTIVRITH